MIYEAECPKCGKQEQYICSLAEMDERLPVCVKCKLKMKRVILTPPMVGAMTWTSHKAVMVNGKLIESGDQYKRMMKQEGYIPLHEAEQDKKKNKAREKVEHKKKLRKAIKQAMAAN